MIYGNTDTQYLERVFHSICNLEVENDGIEYIAETISSTEIREKIFTVVYA